MGRAPCCDKSSVKKGPWSPEEDATLKEYIEKYGIGGSWISFPQKAGLRRCGKSCRLRWLNYLRPDIKHGDFSEEEDAIICHLFAKIGSRWSVMAAQLPGRTDNDIKNYWNTKLKKKTKSLASPFDPAGFPSNPHSSISDEPLPQCDSGLISFGSSSSYGEEQRWGGILERESDASGEAPLEYTLEQILFSGDETCAMRGGDSDLGRKYWCPFFSL